MNYMKFYPNFKKINLEDILIEKHKDALESADFEQD